MSKCDVRACGLSFGIAWGSGIFLAGILSSFFNWGIPFVDLFASFYVGYNTTLLGSLIGAVWGFIDGFIFGILVAWLYNRFAR